MEWHRRAKSDGEKNIVSTSGWPRKTIGIELQKHTHTHKIQRIYRETARRMAHKTDGESFMKPNKIYIGERYLSNGHTNHICDVNGVDREHAKQSQCDGR